MTVDTKRDFTSTAGKFHDDFKALPLDQKFSNLLQMEVDTFSEAIKYVADSSMKILEKVGEAITDFGKKVETEAHAATSANAGSSAEAKPSRAAKPSSTNSSKAKPGSATTGN